MVFGRLAVSRALFGLPDCVEVTFPRPLTVLAESGRGTVTLGVVLGVERADVGSPVLVLLA